MATGNEASWAVTLPNQFEPFGNILQRGIAAKNEQNQMLYNQQLRQQQKSEQDRWKKLSLIQDFTDISKNQTGSDVANAIGNKKMADIMQKYTLSSNTMSPEQLQYELSKEVSGTISAMEGIKKDLELGDAYIKQLKQAYPNLNAERMMMDWRKDVLNRRLKNDTEFTPEISIKPSKIDFSNPESLAKYVMGYKNILKAINEDKGDDVKVLMGRQGDYTKYEGELKSFQKLGFDPSNVDNEGFYIGKVIPSFKLKSSTLPTNVMTDAAGNAIELIDEDVYKRFSEDSNTNLELIAATKNDFPDYDNLSPQQKKYAKRNTLFKIISANDQSRINPTRNVRPPVTHNRTYINNAKPSQQIDLREYPDVEGGKDITSLMQGFDVVSVVTGKKFASDKVIYNPSSKKITFNNPTTGKNETMGLTTFLQNIRSNNANANVEWLRKGLNNPITGNKPSTPIKKEKTVSIPQGATIGKKQ